MMWKFYSQEDFSFSTQFGLHPNPWLAGMHKVVRRYVAQTRSQHWDLNRLADYGASFIGGFGEKGKWGHAYLSMWNGTGANDAIDANPKKDVSFVVWLNPLTSEDFQKSKVGVQYYMGWDEDYDAQDEDNEDAYKYNLMSAMGNIQYKGLFNLGVEYNGYTHKAMEGEDDMKASAMTLFGTLWFAELAEDSKAFQTLNVFFRYGMVDPDADFDDDEVTDMIFGVECNPVKGFATSLNYRSETFKTGEGNDDYIEKYLFLNAV